MSDHEEDAAVVERYARALRQETAQQDAALAAQTRARLLASARKPAAAPRYGLAAAAALALVVCGGSTVWALYSGALPFLRSVPSEPASPIAPRERSAAPGTREVTASHDAPETSVVAPREPSALAPRALAEPAPASDVTPSVREAPHEAHAGATTARSSHPGAVTPASEPARTEPPATERTATERPVTERPGEELPALDGPVDPAERRAYDAAHAAHFEAHDWDRAIENWRAYLAAYPHGRYVPEARWNTAIALVRAGRHAEAREALAPIAVGTFGAYRSREAAALLRAIEAE